MKPKTKAMLFNFLGFAVLFMIARFTLIHFFSFHRLILALIAAVIANILAPKFSAVKTKSGEKLVMKWIFIKEIKEL